MMLKGLFKVFLGRCGVMSSKGDKEQRSIDDSNVHYSNKFKSDRAHSEVAKEIKQVKHHVQQADVNQPQDIVTEGPVQRFKEEQSSRENGLFCRKRRQLRKACEILVRGKFNHTA